MPEGASSARGDEKLVGLAKVCGRAHAPPEGASAFELRVRLAELPLGHELRRGAKPELGLQRLLTRRLEEVCGVRMSPLQHGATRISPHAGREPLDDRGRVL